jgi:hypothetical protein
VHDFVVLEMTHGQLGQSVKEAAKGEFTLSHDSKASQSRFSIAVWVTAVGSPAPLQAIGGWLPGRRDVLGLPSLHSCTVVLQGFRACLD